MRQWSRRTGVGRHLGKQSLAFNTSLGLLLALLLLAGLSCDWLNPSAGPPVRLPSVSIPEHDLPALPSRSSFPALTPEHQKQSEAAYQDALAKWRNSIVGRKVAWKLVVEDVSDSETRIEVRARSYHCDVVAGISKADRRAQGLKPAGPVVLRGRITDISIVPETNLSEERLRIDLADAAIDHAVAPLNSFFGVTTQDDNIVFVIERRGNMLELVDFLRRELRRAISELDEGKSFQVMFMGGEDPFSKSNPGRLVTATKDNKRTAIEFVESDVPAGMPADPASTIQMALGQLDGVRGKKGRTLYLVLSGPYQDHYYQDLATVIAQENSVRAVHINIVLFNTSMSGKDDAGYETLRKIAETNGGTYLRPKWP